MMEFTISRTMLCACGVVMLFSVVAALGGIYDSNEGDMNEELVSKIAYMLDSFQSSEADGIVLEGAEILPAGSCLQVGDNVVTLTQNGKEYHSSTFYDGSFQLSSDGTVKIVRQNPQRSS